MLTKWKQRARRGVAVLAMTGSLAVVGAGAAVAIDVAAPAIAGATATNPGPGMGCTTNSDQCGGWVASKLDPTCEAYRVDWTHNFYSYDPVTYGQFGQWQSNPAYWHVTSYLWWNGGPNCTLYGAAHQVALVGDFYQPDWAVPHISVIGGQGTLNMSPHQQSALYGGYGTSGTTAWTPCLPPSADADLTFMSYVDAGGQSEGQYQAGTFGGRGIDGENRGGDNWCDVSWDYMFHGTGATGANAPEYAYGQYSVNGAWMTWTAPTVYYSGGTQNTAEVEFLFR